MHHSEINTFHYVCKSKISFTEIYEFIRLMPEWQFNLVLSDFINLTQVHNFTVSAQNIFTFRRLSVFTVSFTGILQLLMQIIKRIVPSY